MRSGNLKGGVERSAGAVIFREAGKNKKEFLLLLHEGGHWDFSKGHIEKGEKTEDTVRREVREETGINKIVIVPDFKETIRYFVGGKGERHLKFVAFFLAQTEQKKVKISWEHRGHIWLPYKEAYKRLTYKNAKDVLKKARYFLRKKNI